MNTTLQINPAVWHHAMAYAESRGERLTTIVERYLMTLGVQESTRITESDSVTELVGILPRTAKEWKTSKAKRLQKKYV